MKILCFCALAGKFQLLRPAYSWQKWFAGGIRERDICADCVCGMNFRGFLIIFGCLRMNFSDGLRSFGWRMGVCLSFFLEWMGNVKYIIWNWNFIKVFIGNYKFFHSNAVKRLIYYRSDQAVPNIDQIVCENGWFWHERRKSTESKLNAAQYVLDMSQYSENF